MSLISRIIIWLIRWYTERLVCLHFCKFKQAGSDLKYTHVHILGRNNQGATGLGHDDHTNNDDPGHTTISSRGKCRIQAEDKASMALRRGYLGTAYFHECEDPDSCPPGYTKVICKCAFAGNEENSFYVCYTMDHDTFQRWYDAQKWPHQEGFYEYPYIGVGPGARSVARHEKTLSCGSSLVFRGYAFERVQNCNGFGPTDSDNRLIQEVRNDLRKVTDAISCKAGCKKTVSEIWRGWKCEQRNGSLTAEAMVQWKVECK